MIEAKLFYSLCCRGPCRHSMGTNISLTFPLVQIQKGAVCLCPTAKFCAIRALDLFPIWPLTELWDPSNGYKREKQGVPSLLHMCQKFQMICSSRLISLIYSHCFQNDQIFPNYMRSIKFHTFGTLVINWYTLEKRVTLQKNSICLRGMRNAKHVS